MKRVVLIAKGEVQRVGYRDEVEQLARTLNLCGYVENNKPHDVLIVAEGEEAAIDQFIQLVKINRFPIYVKELIVQNEPYQDEFEYFEIRRGEWHDEISERMDIAGKLLYRTAELGEKSVRLGEKTVSLTERSVNLAEQSVAIGHQMRERQDAMLQKQDQTIAELRTVSQKIDQGKDELVTEIKYLREDIKVEVHQKLARIEEEIAAIKVRFGIA